MVTVIGFQERKTAQGKSFLVLELEGSLQIQSSQISGKLYACKSKCTVPCSFDERTAQELIGSTLPGSIVKTQCEPYSFKNPSTGESMTLDYKYMYKAPELTNENASASLKRPEVIEVI